MGVMAKIKAAFNPEPRTADPAVFNSELATQTGWTPVYNGGANFCTHHLRTDPVDGSLYFAGSGMNKAVGIFFAAAGMAVAAAILTDLLPMREFAGKWAYAIAPLIAVVFTVAGIVLYRVMNPYIAFNPELGAFYRTRKNPRRVEDVTALDNYTPFKEIGALQLIEKWIQGSGKNSSSYKCYELNIVRKNGERVNVICHGSHKKMAEDAVQLAQMLKVPLWNVMDIPANQ